MTELATDSPPTSSTALAPIMLSRLSMEALPQEEPLLQSELHRFLDLAICDGRFWHDVASNPRRVAEQLGFELSSETEVQLRAQPLEQQLAELYAVRYQIAQAIPQGIALGILIVPVAVVIIVGVYIFIREVRGSTSFVRDRSPHAHLKI